MGERLGMNKVNMKLMPYLIEWNQINQTLKELKPKEMLLRKRIFNDSFGTGFIGTEQVQLDNGFTLKGAGKLTKTVDKGSLIALTAELEGAGVPVDKLIVNKPSLDAREYAKLTDAQRLLFDRVLTIKEAAPTLQIIEPKEPKT